MYFLANQNKSRLSSSKYIHHDLLRMSDRALQHVRPSNHHTNPLFGCHMELQQNPYAHSSIILAYKQSCIEAFDILV